MTDVALLNSGAADARAATEMVANLRKRVQDAERRLLSTRAATYENYVSMFDTIVALRNALQEAEETYGRNFKI